MQLQEKEQQLLDLLKINSRMSAAELGRQLGLARSTIHMMLARLEEKIIDSYTVKLKNLDVENQTTCYVLITRDPKKAVEIEEKMRAMAEIDSLVTVAGQHDFIALVRTDSTQHMDRIFTEIAMMDGIIKTESHIILSEKFDRRL
ncbi:Lrp/AsnC family transcriptional regulator [Paremcibacter congregatus]|uniref:Lrp/AsnC family transcriptional regulator n=1 Tax=Paremcibacter congregatus TaxID=2043170 RepID=UPI003A8F0A97